jgi:SP family galactose:H+ symporter-like MFS transporter
MTVDKQSYTSHIYFIGFIAALAGLLFGFDTGIISGAITFVQKQYHLSTEMVGIIVSIVMTGAVCGTLISNIISRHFGRRNALITASILFSVAAVGSALAINAYFLISIRFFLGIAIGIASYTAPLYLAELSPRDIRGKIIAFYQLMIAAGLLAAYCSDMVFTPSGSWRWMLGIAAFPAMLMLIFSLRLPRSPRWLILNQKTKEARKVLSKIFSLQQADKEFTEIEERIKYDKQNKSGWNAIIRNPRFRAVLILGVCAQMMQQWTGCNIVLYYAPIILKFAGFATPVQQMWGTIAVGVVMMSTTIIVVKYVDEWGRRPILFGGLTAMTVSLFLLGLVTGHTTGSTVLQTAAIFAVLFYIFGFAVSLGPIVWILCSEIFPIRIRDFGIMVTTASNWIFNAALATVFPTLIAVLGNNVFFLFVIACTLSFVFVKYFVPETKGVSLEQIEANLMNGNRSRYIGQPEKVFGFTSDAV